MSDEPKIGEFYTHKKRGTLYRVMAVAEVQALKPIREGDKMVIYTNLRNVYARPLQEFMDGRFEEGELPRDADYE